MSDFDLLQSQVTAVIRRLTELENQFKRQWGADAAAARAVAEQLGLEADAVGCGAWGAVSQRRQLARTLAERGWSAARIARALGCCERTAQRLKHSGGRDACPTTTLKTRSGSFP